MQPAPFVVALTYLFLLTGCSGPQHAAQHASQQAPTHAPPASSIGEVVPDIDSSCWIVFQDKDNNYWFGSDGHGVSRYDGKTITRFTTKEGLSNDNVRGIQQHMPTGHILITTNAGVSMFDGTRLVTLPMVNMNAPTPLDQQGWTLKPDDVWLTGSGGPRRYDGATLYHLTLPPCPFEAELTATIPHKGDWGPPDVWSLYKDHAGSLWIGTGVFGVCRFDGAHFDWLFERHLTEIEGGGWWGIRSIVQDRSGDYWICNTQFRYRVQPHGADGQKGDRLKYQRSAGMDTSAMFPDDKFLYFMSATQDNNGDLWMAPYGGPVWKYDGVRVTHYPVTANGKDITMFSIYKDNAGTLWVCTHEHGPYRFNGKAFERFKP